VGFDGLLKMNHLVFGVIAASSCSGVSLKPRLDPAFHRHRRAAGQQHHVGIADPVGRGDDHLVARIAGGHQRVVQDLLAAGADRHLRGV
jgi:hypothetical protein